MVSDLNRLPRWYPCLPQYRSATLKLSEEIRNRPWLEMSARWILGMVSVLFDIDVGPKVQEVIRADGAEEEYLSTEERQDIAFYSFPV